jgi:hypothetical protein
MDTRRTVDIVDFIARLAEAWDGNGRNVLVPPREHLALLGIAGLGRELATLRWDQLNGRERQALVFAARQAVDLGRACAWMFGEGRGA